jgi:hypothetical protein
VDWFTKQPDNNTPESTSRRLNQSITRRRIPPSDTGSLTNNTSRGIVVPELVRA